VRFQARWLVLLFLSVPWMAVVEAQAEDAAPAATTPRDVVLVLDNSGSMRKSDPKFVMRTAVGEFIDGLADTDRVAVILFAESAQVLLPLTDASEAGRTEAKGTLQSFNYRGQRTNSPAAVERAIYTLRTGGRPEALRQVLFLTDGVVDTGNAASDADRAQWLREELTTQAAEAGIRIYSVAFTDQADALLVQSLAQRTRAEYVRADTGADLGPALAQLAGFMKSAVATAAEPASPVVPSEPTPPTPPQPTENPLAGFLGLSPEAASSLAATLGKDEASLLQELKDKGALPEQFSSLEPAQVQSVVEGLLKPKPAAPPVVASPQLTELAGFLQITDFEAQGLVDSSKQDAGSLLTLIRDQGLNSEHFVGLSLDDKRALIEELLKIGSEPPPEVVELAAYTGLAAEEAQRLAEATGRSATDLLTLLKDAGAKPEDFRGLGYDKALLRIADLGKPAPAAPPAAADGGMLYIIIGAVVGIVVLGGLAFFFMRPKSGALMAAAPAGASPGNRASSARIPDAWLTDLLRVTASSRQTLGQKPLVIGRMQGNDPGNNDYLVIEQSTVGRRHAMIEFRDFAFWVSDQGSVNGTFVNGERLQGQNARRLSHGDKVKFHRYEFEFSMPSAAAENDSDRTMIAQAPGDSTMIADRTVIATSATVVSPALATAVTAMAPSPPPAAPPRPVATEAVTQMREAPEGPLSASGDATMLRAESPPEDGLDMFMATNMFGQTTRPTPEGPTETTSERHDGATVVLPEPVVTIDPSHNTSQQSNFAPLVDDSPAMEIDLPLPAMTDVEEFFGAATAAAPVAIDAVEATLDPVAPVDGEDFFDDALAVAVPTAPLIGEAAVAAVVEVDDFFADIESASAAPNIVPAAVEPPPPPPPPPAPVVAAPVPPPAALGAADDGLLEASDATLILGGATAWTAPPPGASTRPAAPPIMTAAPPPAPIAPPAAAAAPAGDAEDVTVMPASFRPPAAGAAPAADKSKASLDDFEFDAFFDDDSSR
jgi:pSer/pThr/pTyr-binding forkhead associated (FHA) protein/Mg-chelatase subunit ChlD